MKERPILFSGPMIRAILESRKTQTRRVVKRPWRFGCLTGDCPHETKKECDAALKSYFTPRACPYGQPGDRLWVRETFCHKYDDNEMPVYNADGNLDPSCCYYSADAVDVLFPDGGGWTPSIHMPRWASRITLEVIAVRIEQLQDISEADAFAEGAGYDYGPQSSGELMALFRHLWDSINGHPRKDGIDISWSANPWVWVVEFRRIED